MLFQDRSDAGRRLAAALAPYAGRADVVALGLPRGGVPVAWEVARALRCPLDALVVRKLGLPGQPELALGALASGGVRVVNRDLLKEAGVSDRALAAVERRELAELRRRETQYRPGRAPPRLEGKTALLIDDGIATGATMFAALRAARRLGASRVVVAAPVASLDTRDALADEADEVVVLETPDPVQAVGLWYRDFGPTSDADVRRLLGVLDPAPKPR